MACWMARVDGPVDALLDGLLDLRSSPAQMECATPARYYSHAGAVRSAPTLTPARGRCYRSSAGTQTPGLLTVWHSERQAKYNDAWFR